MTWICSKTSLQDMIWDLAKKASKKCPNYEIADIWGNLGDCLKNSSHESSNCLWLKTSNTNLISQSIFRFTKQNKRGGRNFCNGENSWKTISENQDI